MLHDQRTVRQIRLHFVLDVCGVRLMRGAALLLHTNPCIFPSLGPFPARTPSPLERFEGSGTVAPSTPLVKSVPYRGYTTLSGSQYLRRQVNK